MKDAQGHGSNAKGSMGKLNIGAMTPGMQRILGVPPGASIEQERDGSWTVYRAGDPYATTGGFKSPEDAARAARGEPTDKDAARALAQGHPKSGTVPVKE